MKYVGMAKALFKYYQKIPKQYRWVVWLFPIIYWIMPVDFLPDYIFGPLGHIDDVIVVMLSFWVFDKLKDMTKIWEKDLGQGKSSKAKHADPAAAAADPYSVLGVPEGSDQETCKRAYRERLQEYHPDKYNHLGAEFEAVARQKTEAVIAAYQQVSQQH